MTEHDEEDEPQERPIKKQWGVIIWGFDAKQEAKDYRNAIFTTSPQYLSKVIEVDVEVL